ncbi:Calx-beta domain-containing protein [Albimonas pacifica]|uniref:Hemolysin-type calcium-binding repeat-containing protein n=1 Tax=Albimonas pacifica TaxID=1114924 RepID=A0A1I3IW52_9RHOB|nr:Calx-beta domain-containing protein [Albimonas pacifica]SFI52204.1 Hemolysin-type calcium-binding repeat-containing protein [Albimonas pacifica]
MPASTIMHDIFGTALDDDLIGSLAPERLFGLAGRDRLYAMGGDDILYGGDGDDLLDGGEGADLMYGGAGNDIYRVDDPGDVVNEESFPGVDDGGVDYVISTISWTLGANVERLELRGDGALDGAGNALNNTIKGAGGANILYGGGGSDILYGYDGGDVLIGGAGKDYLYGGAGADMFVLQPEPGVWDKIYDFENSDRIGVYADAFGLTEGAGLTGGTLDAAWFATGTTATADHGQFIWNPASATLMWDADGTGAGARTTLAMFSAGTVLNASQIVAYAQAPSVSVAAAAAAPAEETDGRAWFALRLSAALDVDAIITVSAVGGTAAAGEDFVGPTSWEVTIRAGSTTAWVPVDILDDDFAEGIESFSLVIEGARRAGDGSAIAIGAGAAVAEIADEGPVVVNDVFTRTWGATDPSGIVYDPVSGTLLISDSEVDEAPFSRSQDLFSVSLSGEFGGGVALPFTTEATGLALDAATGTLFVSDDDEFRIFAVDVSAPQTVLWSFDTLAVGGVDPEDVAFDPITGHLFIVNGETRTIVEVDAHGTTQFSSMVLPTAIEDPEALAYDAQEDVFYVGGGFSADIWKIDRSGAVVDVLTVLRSHYSEDLHHRVSVKDLAFAPASDGSGETHLYVADYGWSHVDDGRLLEIDLGDSVPPELVSVIG